MKTSTSQNVGRHYKLDSSGCLRPVLWLTALAVGATLVLAGMFWPSSDEPKAIASTTELAGPLTGPRVAVYASPSCECCKRWINHLIEHGFDPRIHHTEEMPAIKDRLGVPRAQRSCHTATVNGYFVEGHVPAADIQRLVDEKPAIKGLAVPGMPIGSPGMEPSFGNGEDFSVNAIDSQDQVLSYSKHVAKAGKS